MSDPLDEKIRLAEDRIRFAAQLAERVYGQPLKVAISGGKDSTVLMSLAISSGANVCFIHNLTTVDAPETTAHVRKEFENCERLGYNTKISRPLDGGMFHLVAFGHTGYPPTRMARYCCQKLKEQGSNGGAVCTGVRWAESVRRAGARGAMEAGNGGRSKREVFREDNDETRRLVEQCQKRGEHVFNPIIDWTDEDVWGLIERRGLVVNPFYKNTGLKRCGCVGCPFQPKSEKLLLFRRYPKILRGYLNAFDRGLKEAKRRGKVRTWESAADVLKWWCGLNDEELGEMLLISGFDGRIR